MNILPSVCIAALLLSLQVNAQQMADLSGPSIRESSTQDEQVGEDDSEGITPDSPAHAAESAERTTSHNESFEDVDVEIPTATKKELAQVSSLDEQEQPAWAFWFGLVETTVLVLLVLMTLWANRISRNALTHASKANDLAVIATNKTLRPWLDIDLVVTEPLSWKDYDDMSIGVACEVRNFGQAPALRATVDVDFVLGSLVVRTSEFDAFCKSLRQSADKYLQHIVYPGRKTSTAELSTNFDKSVISHAVKTYKDTAEDGFYVEGTLPVHAFVGVAYESPHEPGVRRITAYVVDVLARGRDAPGLIPIGLDLGAPEIEPQKSLIIPPRAD